MSSEKWQYGVGVNHGPLADERIARAVQTSMFGGLPTEVLDRVLADALFVDVPAGGVIYREGEAPRTGLVVTGLVRIYLTSIEGRQLTVRYARTGATLGAPTAIGGPAAVAAQAVIDCSLLMFSATALRAIAGADVRVAWPLAQEVTRLLYGVLDAFAGTAFGSVRQRLARHLLDLATAHQRGALLVVALNHQALADAIGSAREVVSRTVQEFRQAGLIRTSRAGIVLVDADALEEVASSGDL